MFRSKKVVASIIILIIGITAFTILSNPAKKVEAPTIPTAITFAHYEGTLPCADCEGVSTELTLYKQKDFLSEGSYMLSETYLGKNTKPFVEYGEWVEEKGTGKLSGRSVYVLTDQYDNIRRFSVATSSVTLLNRDGDIIESQLNYSLQQK